MGKAEQQFEHLTDAQIEHYGDRTSGEGPNQNGLEVDQAIETHLADCAGCRTRVLEFHRSRFGLMSDPFPSAAWQSHPPTAECPSEDALCNLAAGLSSSSESATLTQHAAQCPHCGPILRAYIEDFSDDLTPEDQALLSKLKSSSPEWQKKMAQQMAAAVSPVSVTGDARVAQPPSAVQVNRSPKRSRFHLPSLKWILAPVALAATAVIAFFIWNAQRETPEKVEKLLAQAYTEQRTMEMRWPGAEYAPLRVTRGTEKSRFDKPAPLLEAEGLIGRNEHKRANDPGWLRAKAHAELLEQRPDPAIDELTKALEQQPDSVSLKLSLAIAYFQKGDSTHDGVNYAHAIDLLNWIVRQKQINPVAIFDLAVTYMKMEMWDKAAAEWEEYLRHDTSSPWAEEGRKRLRECKLKLQARHDGPPSINPALAIRTLPNDIDYEIENYQDITIQAWLSTALKNPQSTTHSAVSKIAELLNRKHSDPWLLDFLKQSDKKQQMAVMLLSSAAKWNAEGHYQQALHSSLEARQLFEIHANIPGRLRAQFEAAYAEQRLVRGGDCESHTRKLETSLAGTPYAWLKSQVHIERAICLNFVGNISEANSELAYGFRVAEQSHFPVLLLRQIGMSQGLEIQQGRYPDAWQDGLRGLDAYWPHPVSAQRLYQFYVSLALAAEHMNLWSAADDLQRKAILIAQKEPDQSQLGAARLELAKILTAEKDDIEAEREYLAANSILQNNSSDETSNTYLLVGKIGLAELQLRRGNPALALETLQPVESLLWRTKGYFIPLHYYQILATGYWKQGSLEPASEAYKQAILTAERSLPQIKNEEERLEWVRLADDAYRGLVRVFLAAGRSTDALNLWEWYLSRSYPQDLLQVSTDLHSESVTDWPTLWKKISSTSEIDGKVSHIVYAVFADGVEIWSSNQGNLKAAWVPVSEEKLERIVRQFSEACAREDSSLSKVQELGKELFTLLIHRSGAELPVMAPVALELDQLLSPLPFEALRSPDGWYFGERHPIVYSPGILYERHLRNNLSLSSQQSFLLLDSPTSGYLPGRDLEISTIRHFFPKAVTIEEGRDPLKIVSQLRHSAIFGFIGHGEPVASGTGLRLSPNLLLKAEDFRPSNLFHLQLAVLAACSTGLGGDDGLLDNRSLVHAFLAGGTPSVVASRWNVDSEATAILISDFYTGLAHNESTPNALFFARNQLLKTYNHPYYWASFTVTGKAN